MYPLSQFHNIMIFCVIRNNIMEYVITSVVSEWHLDVLANMLVSVDPGGRSH